MYITGLLHTGLGERQGNNLLSVMNMNMVSPNALRVREKEIGELLSALAEELCDEALQNEKALSSK